MIEKRSIPGLLVLVTGFFSCLPSRSQVQRSYYVLHSGELNDRASGRVPGTVRVRNLDPASAYEKFQFVVRRNPFELRYSEENVWAVKPNRMVSDVIATALQDSRAFTSVTRELGEIRPHYIIGGDLRAIEIYDSGDIWYAHLSFTLNLSRFKDGAVLLTYEFKRRKPVPRKTFAQGARAISELLTAAMNEFLATLRASDLVRSAPKLTPRPTSEDRPPPEAKEPETIFVPEDRR